MKGFSSRRLSHIVGVFTAAGALLAMGGCTPLKVRMGWKVYLDKTPIASIAATLPDGPGIAPGEKSPLVVAMTQPDGKVLQTEGKGGGKVLWADLDVDASLVIVNPKGILRLPEDPRISEGKAVHVIVTVPSHPDMRAELDIPVRYDYKFVSNFAGHSGTDGMSGWDGTNGSTGSSGSIDPNNPSPGGNGSDGTDGSNGKDGDAGGNAPPVQIRIRLTSESHPLVQAAVTAAGVEKFYLVDPRGGSLTVIADGGAGGSGGRGGHGGWGGAGGSGIPSGSSGRNGADGRSGWDGSRGRGGSITVIYDPLAKPFLHALHLSNQNGPAPVFDEEPLGPFW